MKKIFLTVIVSLLLSGCMSLPTGKLPGWSSLGGKKSGDTALTIADARSGAQSIDRMAEITRREEEVRKNLEEKYAKFREELQAAYDERTRVDYDNFDRISEINYGIYFATKDLVTTDRRILVANLKSQVNMNRLMPLSTDIKKAIEAETEIETTKTPDELLKKYDKVLADGIEAALAYEKADAEVQRLEKQKIVLRNEEKIVMAKVLAEQEAERNRLKKEADDAVAVARELQKQEMIGWIVKALLGVGILVLIPGFLMKSPTMIISGIGMLGLSYVAATIPFWIVSTIMGIFILIMIVVDPKNGTICFFNKKKITSSTGEQEK